MNSAERSVLSPLIKRIREVNPHAWWELKRQIWDGGYQPHYPMQGEFERPARRAIETLSPERMAILRDQWQKHHLEGVPAEQAVVDHYVHVLIEEVVKRANHAAYRTTNW